MTVSESSWSDKTSKPDTEQSGAKSSSTGSNSTPEAGTKAGTKATEAIEATEAAEASDKKQGKKTDPVLVAKPKLPDDQRDQYPFLGPLKPINPKTFPSVYESVKRTLKGQKGPAFNRSLYVYRLFLNMLFDYPFQKRHAKCIQALRPCYTCCIDEGCPSVIFLTTPIKMRPFPFPKKKSRRQRFMDSLDRNIHKLLQKLNLSSA